MTVSYYALDGNSEIPEYQVSFDMYENGVATGLVLDYGEFALSGRLADLKRHGVGVPGVVHFGRRGPGEWVPDPRLRGDAAHTAALVTDVPAAFAVSVKDTLPAAVSNELTPVA